MGFPILKRPSIWILGLGFLISEGSLAGNTHDSRQQKSGVAGYGSRQVPSEQSSPHFSTNRGNPRLLSLTEAEAQSEAYCTELKTPFFYRATLYGMFTSEEKVQDVQTSFPYSLLKASSKHREQLINCSDVNVVLTRWTMVGYERAIDSNVPVLNILGLLSGETSLPGPGKFGGYAQMQTQCIPRSADEQDLLKRFYACLESEEKVSSLDRTQQVLSKNGQPTDDVAKMIQDAQNLRPLGCDEVKRQIESKKIAPTHFTPLDEVQCVEK